MRRRIGITDPNPQRHKRQICRNNALKCSLIDKLLTALLPFLAKNLLFLNSQTQCAGKFLFRCYCRVKQGCRLANPEKTAERKFNKHWAHVFESVMPKQKIPQDHFRSCGIFCLYIHFNCSVTVIHTVANTKLIDDIILLAGFRTEFFADISHVYL